MFQKVNSSFNDDHASDVITTHKLFYYKHCCLNNEYYTLCRYGDGYLMVLTYLPEHARFHATCRTAHSVGTSALYGTCCTTHTASEMMTSLWQADIPSYRMWRTIHPGSRETWQVGGLLSPITQDNTIFLLNICDFMMNKSNVYLPHQQLLLVAGLSSTLRFDIAKSTYLCVQELKVVETQNNALSLYYMT